MTDRVEALSAGETWRCPGCRDTTAPMGMCQRCGVFGLRYESPDAARQSPPLDRQWFYDGLPKDADDDLYAIADAIYENVVARLAVKGEQETERPKHEHHWTDAPDDETAWHCPTCGVTEYPDTPPFGAE